MEEDRECLIETGRINLSPHISPALLTRSWLIGNLKAARPVWERLSSTAYSSSTLTWSQWETWPRNTCTSRPSLAACFSHYNKQRIPLHSFIEPCRNVTTRAIITWPKTKTIKLDRQMSRVADRHGKHLPRCLQQTEWLGLPHTSYCR